MQRDLVALGEHQLAEVDRRLAGEHPQQRRLAGAVAARQRHPVAALELERDPAQQRLARDVLAEVRCDHDRHADDGRRGRAHSRSPPMPRPPWPPVPPIEMPPARTVVVPGRGEFFLRDTGGDGAGGDAAARVDGQRRPQLARRLRRWPTPATGCWRSTIAGTAAGCGRWSRSGWPTVPPMPPACCGRSTLAPALVVGYSMGGTIAQLIARDHRDVVARAGAAAAPPALPGAETRPAVEVDGRAGPGAVGRAAGEPGGPVFAGSAWRTRRGRHGCCPR